MFLISIKYSFKKINVSFQTIHCLILYLDRCLYSSLKKKDQHLFNINHAYQTLKKYMQCKIKIPFNEKKKQKFIRQNKNRAKIVTIVQSPENPHRGHSTSREHDKSRQ